VSSDSGAVKKILWPFGQWLNQGGLFEFWLRFGSVTGFYKPAPSPKPVTGTARQNSKIPAPNGYTIFLTALR
jgi:hypothetical protein